MATDWIVHKFGGSSLMSASSYRAVAAILESQPETRLAVVVSAMGGVTDRLLELNRLASCQDSSYSDQLESLRHDQLQTIRNLIPPTHQERLIQRIEDDFNDMRDILRALWLLQSQPLHAVNLLSGFGELWSAQVLATYLQASGHQVAWLDARRVLTVRAGEVNPIVDWERSRAQFGTWLQQSTADFIVITGFVASDLSGLPTTLGRNGSDFSASIFASLLDAHAIHIWTDVDGVLSADPKQVPEAVLLESLSYDEAMELAYFGAKVIHPSTMAPAIELGIPIYIRNTFNPKAPGTKIHHSSQSDTLVKGFASIDGIALVNLEGSGMIGVPGIAERLFGALREAGVSVVMISQASSEHSICFAIPQTQATVAREAIERTFQVELQARQIQTLDVLEDCTILAVVGDNMSGTPGLSGLFFAALGRAGVNVRAVAQGSSERNISTVIASRDATRALRAVHSGFYLSDQTISIGVIGPGLIGSTLLKQIHSQAERLRNDFRIDLRVRGILSRSRMLLDERRLDLGRWSERFERDGTSPDLQAFADHIQTDSIPHSVLIDCTAEASVAEHYADWLEHGIHVITPNKKANSKDYASYRRLREASRRQNAHYLYETTVGAALPIISTLRDLIQTGDEIVGIEGILSGTLSYLFNSFDGKKPFSEIIRQAKSQGYTEPDPREDLSGMDVARKVVILAREMGLQLELTDLRIDSLVPAELAEPSVDVFLEKLADFDAEMFDTIQKVEAAGESLRYVGVIDPAGQSSVQLRRYPRSHPFARIQYTDNIVLFRTRRYSDNPLVIQGPGAGPDVTAGGVFADLLRLATYVGATL